MSVARENRSAATRLPVHLAPVTRANWQAVIALRLEVEQAQNLASNLYSLAEAYVEPSCRPFAIVAGETVVGFVMFEYLAHSGICNVPRFMVDARWQGRGYGRAGLSALIETLALAHPGVPVVISLLPDNNAARALYEALDFVATGQMIHGEMLMRREPGVISR